LSGGACPPGEEGGAGGAAGPRGKLGRAGEPVPVDPRAGRQPPHILQPKSRTLPSPLFPSAPPGPCWCLPERFPLRRPTFKPPFPRRPSHYAIPSARNCLRKHLLSSLPQISNHGHSEYHPHMYRAALSKSLNICVAHPKHSRGLGRCCPLNGPSTFETTRGQHLGPRCPALPYLHIREEIMWRPRDTGGCEMQRGIAGEMDIGTFAENPQGTVCVWVCE